MLAATAAGLGNVALAQAPLRSLRPEARAAAASSGVKSAITAASVVGAHKLSGLVGCALVDPLNGEILDQHFPELQLPPASVTKAITAAFGLQNLGPKYCFETRLHVVGKVSNGLLRGDLMLIGSADPTLHTDDLVRFAKALHKTGIRRVEGRLLIVDDGFAYLPKLTTINCPKPTTIRLSQVLILTSIGCSSNGSEGRMGAMTFLCMRRVTYIGHKSPRSKCKQLREALPAIPMRIPPVASVGRCNVRLWAKMWGGGCLHAIRCFTQVRHFRGFVPKWGS